MTCFSANGLSFAAAIARYVCAVLIISFQGNGKGGGEREEKGGKEGRGGKGKLEKGDCQCFSGWVQ